jgi:chemotaxis protein methyltransferase CheR
VENLRCSPFSALHKEAVEVMTTNETSFFRDLTPFAVFRDPLLPEIIKENSRKKRLNIWCGASSSGQEPYSILFTILEHFPELRTWSINFFATDLSKKMIARCREGQYSHLEIQRGLLPTLLRKYFTENSMGWQVRDEVRRMLDLREMNLADNWLAFPKMDFVFIRNVLIYFDVRTKKQILKKVRGVLEPHVSVGGTFVYRSKK